MTINAGVEAKGSAMSDENNSKDEIVNDNSSATEPEEEHRKKLSSTNSPLLSSQSDLVDLDIDEDLQKILYYAFDEATKKIENGEDMVPFTLTLAGDDVFMDEHPGDETEQCFDSAKKSVNLVAHLANAYVFCYDGFINTEDGEEYDMLICELGIKNEPKGNGYGLVYRINEDDDSVVFDEAMLDLGEVDNLFDPDQVAAAEAIAEAYRNVEREEAGADSEEAGESDSE
jgi:hypothetical protein